MNTLKPFKRFCITLGEIPSSYLESMSYYETLVWLCNYLNKTIEPSLKETQEAVTELQEFVSHYFDNLDVQEEINNKLDEMAESGELTDIIAQYLDLAGVLAYNTTNDMVEATNLTNGSTCYTLGQNTYNDGKGAFYKIRTITSDDTIDGINIIALNISNTLIAEKINNYYINELNKDMSLRKNKKYLFIGDSYGSGEIGSSWVTNIITYLGLTNNVNAWNYCLSGAFFYKNSESTWYSFNDQLNKAYSEITIDKNTITDIVVCGGYNDAIYTGGTEAQIENAISEFISNAKNKFPNANVTIGHIGWCRFPQNFENLRKSIRAYKTCTKYGAKYINNIEYTLHNYGLFDSSEYHPNSDGNMYIAQNVISGLLSGSCDVHYETEVTITPAYEDGFTLSTGGSYTYKIKSTTDNEISTFEFARDDNLVGEQINTEAGTRVYNSDLYNGVAFFTIDKDTTCFLGEQWTNRYMTILYVDTSNQVIYLGGSIKVSYGSIVFNNETASVVNMKNVVFPSFAVVSPTLYC